MSSKVFVDKQGFVYVDGVKIGRRVGGQLEFVDKDNTRSKLRGSRYVYIEPEQLVKEIKEKELSKK